MLQGQGFINTVTKGRMMKHKKPPEQDYLSTSTRNIFPATNGKNPNSHGVFSSSLPTPVDNSFSRFVYQLLQTTGLTAATDDQDDQRRQTVIACNSL